MPATSKAATAVEAMPRHSDEGDPLLTFWTKILAEFTAILAAFAGLQVVLFFWQLRLMRATVKDTQSAAEAAKRSAEATERSVAQAAINSLRELRAYVSCELHHSFFVNDDKTICWVFHSTWSNSGRSPTSYMRTRVVFHTSAEQIKSPDDLPWQPVLGHAFLVAGARASGPSSGIFDSKMLNDIRGRKRFLYIFGIIEYSSIFDSDSEFETRFSTAVEVYGDPNQPTVPNPIPGRPPLNGVTIMYRITDSNNVMT